jgi:hypothetical protein
MDTGEVRYEFKTVQSIRGMEARTRAKWEGVGWELVEQADPFLLRSKLTFRRQKKSIRGPLLIAGGAMAAGILSLVILGLVTGGFHQPASSASPPAATAVAEPTKSVKPTSAATEAPAVGTQVNDSEVVSAFRSFFAERAAAGVMVGKAVTNVSYVDRVVRVTFDPAAAGVTQETFDQFNSFDNLAKFAAATIAFDEPIGNRLRPAIDSIDTVNPAGTSLGTLSSNEILALNGLSK